MKKATKKPTFVVIYNEFGQGIQFKNIFEFGQLWPDMGIPKYL